MNYKTSILMFFHDSFNLANMVSCVSTCPSSRSLSLNSDTSNSRDSHPLPSLHPEILLFHTSLLPPTAIPVPHTRLLLWA